MQMQTDNLHLTIHAALINATILLCQTYDIRSNAVCLSSLMEIYDTKPSNNNAQAYQQ